MKKDTENELNKKMKLELQILQSHNLDELKELILLFEDVFEMKNFKLPDETHLRKLLAKENFFAVVAKTNDKIIGGLTIYVLDQYYSHKPLAYIYDLAVLTNYQRKGVGKSLIAFTNNFCKQKGFEEVFVQADKVDDYAIDFYRTTKPTNEEQVVHFYYTLNE
ncbi:GNAT family N-acetyltransferase [Chryseobacterium sp. APV1]|uniref:GNAT family N-acetyltransferase n=2 Tax=Bacteroidota/Chlorobiota group TaxID=68336 RepID=A0ABT8U8F2_9FLAO|nr:GNAT family N-acetyltransferase [Chryseobacterium sp. APV1]MDO3427361.1 GNAT family N-acetyltransferase [Chryseobacterium sp. APV1]